MFKPFSFCQLHALGFQSLSFPLFLNTLGLKLRAVKNRADSLLNLARGGASAASLLAIAEVGNRRNIVVADSARIRIVQATL